MLRRPTPREVLAVDAGSVLPSPRVRAAGLLAALCVVSALASAARADEEVLAWSRLSAWGVEEPVELFAGPLPFGSWSADVFEFGYPDPADEKLVAMAIFDATQPVVPKVMATCTASGSEGLKLKCPIEDLEEGEGTLVLVMDPGLHRFTGEVKFKSPRLKGEFVGVYERTFPGPPDVSDVSMRVGFTEKQKQKGLAPGGKATVLVSLVNFGPQAFPLGVQNLRLAFAFDPGDAGSPFPVEILKVLTIDAVRGWDIDLVPATMAPLVVPFAIKDELVLGVQFSVPAEAAGHELTVTADLPQVDPGDPGPLSVTAADSVPIAGLDVGVRMRNTHDENPIHIVLDDGRPASEQLLESDHIKPGRSRKLKVGGVRGGDVLTFLAGRGGTVLGTCAATVLGPGTVTVTWDPTAAPSSLSCE